MERLPRPTVTADWADDDLMALKVQTSQLELNIYLTRPELAQLARVRATDAGSQRLGTILDAPAWWCIDPEGDLLFILGGPDDETWEVGATLPLASLEAIVAEVAAAMERG